MCKIYQYNFPGVFHCSLNIFCAFPPLCSHASWFLFCPLFWVLFIPQWPIWIPLLFWNSWCLIQLIIALSCVSRVILMHLLPSYMPSQILKVKGVLQIHKVYNSLLGPTVVSWTRLTNSASKIFAFLWCPTQDLICNSCWIFILLTLLVTTHR